MDNDCLFLLGFKSNFIFIFYLWKKEFQNLGDGGDECGFVVGDLIVVIRSLKNFERK